MTTGQAQRRPIPASVLRRYVGGSGLGAWLLLAHDAPRHDPLSPDAPLALVFSPLVGSPLTTSAKFAVVSRSPLTGMLNDALSSSGFALAGKKCGVDAIVITGRAEQPSVVVIDDGVGASNRPPTCGDSNARRPKSGSASASRAIGSSR